MRPGRTGGGWLAMVVAWPVLAADPAASPGTRTAATSGDMPVATRDAAFAPEPERRMELRRMLVQDCGSCHGGTLKGGLGPPLTVEALAGKDPYVLARVILDGRHGTPMAPWKLFLNEREAEWLARQLLAGTAHEP